MHDARAARAGDVALAVILALVPLLPSGFDYLGLPPASYVELAVLALSILWVVARWRGQAGEDAPREQLGGAVGLAWGGCLVVLVGAGWVGIAAENDLSSPVFWAHLSEAPLRLFLPADMATYPLHPLRVMLTFAEGLLAFAIVRDLCRRAPSPRRRARAALGGWMTGLAIVSGVAVVQHQTEFALHPYWVRVNPELVRAHATFDDPNALGSFLVLGLGLLAAAVLAARSPRRRGALLALTVLAGIALWTTKSRAAWGGLLIGVTVLLAVFPPRWLPERLGRLTWARLGARVGLVVLVLAITVSSLLRAPAAPGFQERQARNTVEVIVNTLDPQQPLQAVLKGRLGWWQAAAAMFREHPLTGVGLGRFPRLASRYRPQTAIQENTHNLYLQLAAEAGLVGIAALLILLGTTFWALVRAMRTAPRPAARLLAAGAFAGGLGFCVTMLTGHVLLLPSGQLVWASALALVLVLVESERSDVAPGSETPARQRAGFGAAVAMGAAFLAYAAAATVAPFAMAAELPWGYSWGLYPAEEDTSGRSFRWTGQRALMDLSLPPTASRLELPMAAPNPVRGGQRTVVRVRIDGTAYAVSPGERALEVVGMPLPGRGGRSSVLVEIEVSPTYVPAAVGASRDSRRLGVQIFEPRIDAGTASR